MQRSWMLVLLAASPLTAQQPSPTNLIEKAKQYLSLNMFDNARQTLEAALKENEFDPSAHFLMGKLWFADKNWAQAEKEFRIAYSIEPTAGSVAGRLALSTANRFQQTGERDLQAEALLYCRACLARGTVPDPFEGPEEIRFLNLLVEAIQEKLPGIEGRWATGAGGEYIFQEAGSSGVYSMSPHGTLQFGNLRRTGLRSFEGELATSGCSMELALQETEDRQNLSGTIRVSQPPKRACRRMAMMKDALRGVPSPFNIHRH